MLRVQIATDEVMIVPEVKKTEETPFLPDEEIADDQKESFQEEIVVPEIKKPEQEPVQEIKEEQIIILEEQMPQSPAKEEGIIPEVKKIEETPVQPPVIDTPIEITTEIEISEEITDF